MRWIKKPDPKVLGFRAIKRFALFPIQVKDEYRWLETCYIFQERWEDFGESGWENKHWLTKEEYKLWHKGCKNAKWNGSCKHKVGEDGCELRYNALQDNCGNCLQRIGFKYGSKEHNS